MNLKKSPKANIEKFRLLFIQSGLILGLASTLCAFEWTAGHYISNLKIEGLEDELMDEIVEEIPMIEATKLKAPTPPKPKVFEEIEIIKEDEKIEKEVEDLPDLDLDLDDSDDDQDTLITFEPTGYRKGPVNAGNMGANGFLPRFKECKGIITNEEAMQCVNQGVSRHLSKRLSSLSHMMPEQKTRVYATFVVDENGHVSDVQIRSKKPISKKLKTHVADIMKQMPEMIPGSQNNYPIAAKFTIPIVFSQAL